MKHASGHSWFKGATKPMTYKAKNLEQTILQRFISAMESPVSQKKGKGYSLKKKSVST